MPIQPSLVLQSVSDLDFAAIDDAVMRCAYASQNHFGNLFDERIYENDLAARLRAEGFDVHTQVPVTVTHGSFVKTYYLDLVVNQMLYELKAVATLIPEHEMQAIHYAMMLEIRLVKLLNFGGDKVRGKLLPNAMHDRSRYQPRMRNTGWHQLSHNCERLIVYLKELISDWGTHLHTRLYNEALVHHFGGEVNCLQRAEVCSEGKSLGTHLVQMHGPNHAFAVTSFTEPQPNYLRHLEVLLRHVPAIEGLQWINLNHSRLEITTVTRP
jgi:GxxExxY protein